MSDITTINRLVPVAVGAERLGVPVKKVYDLVAAGVIPAGVAVRVGRQLRIDTNRLESWIEAGGAGFPEGGWRKEAR